MAAAAAAVSPELRLWFAATAEGATEGERRPLVVGAFAFPALCELERDLEP